MTDSVMPRRSFLTGAAATGFTLVNPFSRAVVVANVVAHTAKMVLPAIGKMSDFALVFLGNQMPDVVSKRGKLEVSWNQGSFDRLEQLLDPEKYFETNGDYYYSEIERLLNEGFNSFFKQAPKDIRIIQLFDPQNIGILKDLAVKMESRGEGEILPEAIQDSWLSVLKAVSSKHPELGTLEDLLQFDFFQFYEKIYEPTYRHATEILLDRIFSENPLKKAGEILDYHVGGEVGIGRLKDFIPEYAKRVQRAYDCYEEATNLEYAKQDLSDAKIILIHRIGNGAFTITPKSESFNIKREHLIEWLGGNLPFVSDIDIAEVEHEKGIRAFTLKNVPSVLDRVLDSKADNRRHYGETNSPSFHCS